MAYFLPVPGIFGFFGEFSIQIICLFMPLHLLLVFSPVNMPRVCAKEMLDEVNCLGPEPFLFTAVCREHMVAVPRICGKAHLGRKE